MADKFGPSLLQKAIPQNWRSFLPTGKEIDDEFIGRGFVGVREEMDFINRVYGPESYAVFLNSQSDREAFVRYRKNSYVAGEKIEKQREASPTAIDELWREIITDDELTSYAKTSLLYLVSKERYEEMMEPHALRMLEVRREEEETLCTVLARESVDLRDLSTVSLRKQACNTAMGSAYGAMGFAPTSKKRDVEIYSRRFSNGVLLCAEPDVITLQRNAGSHVRPRLAYWPLVSYDQFLYIGKPRDRIKNLSSSLPTAFDCIAATRKNRFDDTRSLEVMIRTNALFDELKIAAIEKAIESQAGSC